MHHRLTWVGYPGIVAQFHHKFLQVQLYHGALTFREKRTKAKTFQIRVRSKLDADCLVEWAPDLSFGQSLTVALSESVCAGGSDLNQLLPREYCQQSRSPKNCFATLMPVSVVVEWWNGRRHIAPKPDAKIEKFEICFNHGRWNLAWHKSRISQAAVWTLFAGQFPPDFCVCWKTSSKTWTEQPTTLHTCCSNMEEGTKSCGEEKMIPKKCSSSLHAARVTSISRSIDTDLVVSKENSDRPGSIIAIFCWKLAINAFTWRRSADSANISRAALHASGYCSHWRCRCTIERNPSLPTHDRWGVICCGDSCKFGLDIGAEVTTHWFIRVTALIFQPHCHPSQASTFSPQRRVPAPPPSANQTTQKERDARWFFWPRTQGPPTHQKDIQTMVRLFWMERPPLVWLSHNRPLNDSSSGSSLKVQKHSFRIPLGFLISIIRCHFLKNDF